jgi:hypothetical protein
MKIEKISGVIAFVLTIGGIGWWWFGHISEAKTDHTEQVTIVEAVEKLTAIHIRQDTVEEAEKAQLKKLCDEGKLIDCVKDDENE